MPESPQKMEPAQSNLSDNGYWSAWSGPLLGMLAAWLMACAGILMTPSLRNIYEDFDTQLPLMSRVVVHTPWWMWLMLAIAFTTLFLLLVGLGRQSKAAPTCGWIAAAVLVIAIPLLILALYQPLLMSMSSLT